MQKNLQILNKSIKKKTIFIHFIFIHDQSFWIIEFSKNKIEIVLTIISDGACPIIIANGSKISKKSEIFFKLILFKFNSFLNFFLVSKEYLFFLYYLYI